MFNRSIERPRNKIALIGDAESGKSSLVNQFVHSNFRETYTYTIGIDFANTKVLMDGSYIPLQLWDIGGKKHFQKLLACYLKDLELTIIVFDVTQQSSFDSLSSWIRKAQDANPSTPIIIVANKTDLSEQRVITSEMIESFARTENLHFIETSAKDRTTTTALFMKCASLLPKKQEQTPFKYNLKIQAQLSNLIQDNPGNKHVKAIVNTLQTGLSTDNPQYYFKQNFQTDFDDELRQTIKYHINQLARTSKSVCNSVLNVVVTVLLALSVVGLPLAYCLGVLDSNKKASGHSFMFFAFGEKQQGISAINQVFEKFGVEHRM